MLMGRTQEYWMFEPMRKPLDLEHWYPCAKKAVYCSKVKSETVTFWPCCPVVFWKVTFVKLEITVKGEWYVWLFTRVMLDHSMV